MHIRGLNMYRNQASNQLKFKDFNLPFGGELSGDNRWVLLAELIPWDKIEKLYAKNFSDNGMGAPAKSGRLAAASLIIQERLNLTDEETVFQIQENPYLQYFIGYSEYKKEVPFDPSLLVYFRKRINSKMINEVNEEIMAKQGKKEEERIKKQKKKDDNNKKNKNCGKLIIDATCVPQDIRYPTDLSLLNEAREKCEEIIDELHKPLAGKEPKPRTYRQKARRDYLKLAKRRKLKKAEIRKGLGKQLRYVKRDLEHIRKLSKKTGLMMLNKRQYKNLLVIHELYRQQEIMYQEKTHTLSGRIVSISQPHIRPIVRGKAGTPTEFGSKISISVINGYSCLDRLSWDSYNESTDLETQVESYKTRYRVYPKSVHADQIYRTKDNIRYCKKRGIRLSGKALGRPKKIMTSDEIRKVKKQAKADYIYRIAVEGKFGQGKRRFGLNRIMTKLAITSETVISMIIFIMNLEKTLRRIFFVQFFQRILLSFQELFNKKKEYNKILYVS